MKNPSKKTLKHMAKKTLWQNDPCNPFIMNIRNWERASPKLAARARWRFYYVYMMLSSKPGFEHLKKVAKNICGKESTNDSLILSKVLPEIARSVLPLSLATKVAVTANYREWRHIFKLRCEEHAHPDMRDLMIPLLHEAKQRIPVVFDDIPY